MTKAVRKIRKLAKQIARRMGYEVTKFSNSPASNIDSPASNINIAIASLATQRKLTFVQVGANDGVLEDPIYHDVMAYGHQALLIEPQPWLLGTLRENYAAFTGKLMIENIAIGPDNGTLPLHTLKKEFWDEYTAMDGRSPTILFTPNRKLLRGRISKRMKISLDEAERRLDVIDVPMQTLSDVITRNGLQVVDVLQVDCEGWDVQVILSLGPYRPAVINFESLSLSDSDRMLFSQWSERNGYVVFKGRKDSLAIRSITHA